MEIGRRSRRLYQFEKVNIRESYTVEATRIEPKKKNLVKLETRYRYRPLSVLHDFLSAPRRPDLALAAQRTAPEYHGTTSILL